MFSLHMKLTVLNIIILCCILALVLHSSARTSFELVTNSLLLG